VSSPFPIGPRILKAREASGLSLSDVAEKCALSKGFLSRVERGLASPSVDSLIRICEVVGLAMEDLFASPAFTVTRANARRTAALPGAEMSDTVLTPTYEKRVTVIETVAKPSGSGGLELYSMPAECEVCYVLSGRLELVIGEEVILLSAGDAVTFSGTTPHTWSYASEKEDVKMIWIIAPALPNPWIRGASGIAGGVAEH